VGVISRVISDSNPRLDGQDDPADCPKGVDGDELGLGFFIFVSIR
jgi:hypothetical protein